MHVRVCNDLGNFCFLFITNRTCVLNRDKRFEQVSKQCLSVVPFKGDFLRQLLDVAVALRLLEQALNQVVNEGLGHYAGDLLDGADVENAVAVDFDEAGTCLEQVDRTAQVTVRDGDESIEDRI